MLDCATWMSGIWCSLPGGGPSLQSDNYIPIREHSWARRLRQADATTAGSGCAMHDGRAEINANAGVS